MDIKIRTAVPGDLEGIYSVEKECFSDPWSKNTLSDLIGSDKSYMLIAMYEDTIIGFANYMLFYDEVNITNIGVLKQYRRMGIGSILLSSLIDNALKDGYSSMTLEVRTSNTAAKNLYNRFGFVTEGIRKKYYIDNNEDAEIMWLRK